MTVASASNPGQFFSPHNFKSNTRAEIGSPNHTAAAVTGLSQRPMMVRSLHRAQIMGLGAALNKASATLKPALLVPITRSL
ncbi:MAG: hypothetical protein LT080_07515 [Thiobacillus sp.]|nr:hypothetical protein [Thiobacillus sp.]